MRVFERRRILDTARQIPLVILTRRPNPRLKVRQVVWDGDSVGDWACELEGPDTGLIKLAGKLVDCRRRPAPVFSSRPDAP